MEPSYVKVIRALNNPIRRTLLRAICENTYAINELADKLTAENIDYKSRDSLYKHVEILADAGLLMKFYDVQKKAISYRNPVVQVAIDIEKMTVQIITQESRLVAK